MCELCQGVRRGEGSETGGAYACKEDAQVEVGGAVGVVKGSLVVMQ